MKEEEINSVILTVMKGVAVVVIIIGYSFLIYLFIYLMLLKFITVVFCGFWICFIDFRASQM